MKASFKQYNSFFDLPDEQITEEKLNEIFGAFFGGKSKDAKTKAMDELKAKKSKMAVKPGMKKTVAQAVDDKSDKHGDNRSADFDFAMNR
jgi:hypothetical protein